MGIHDAEHEGTAPGSSNLVISKLTCSLVGQTQAIKIMPGTLARQVYGKEEVAEKFRCNYGLDPEYRDKIGSGVLKISGVDPNGEVRIVELSDHRFFITTLFLPQLSSSFDMPHPLMIAYMQAAKVFQRKNEVNR